MSQKNFTISRPTTTARLKTKLPSTFCPPKSRRHIVLPLTRKELLELVVPKVGEAWEMVASMGLELSRVTVLRYLGKRMQANGFHNGELIAEVLRGRELGRLEKERMEEVNVGVLLFEVEQMKEELEQFLKKRFMRDIGIMQWKIEQADGEIKECVDAEDYQKLVNSFRPLLITNSTDLAQEYQAIRGPSSLQAPRSSRLQQYRYAQLGVLERQICKLHNRVVEMQYDPKLFPNASADLF